MPARSRGWGGGLPYLTGSIVHNRLCWFMECSGGPLPLPLHTHPRTPPIPKERKIIFRIVNFKHEKAVFNLAETGLSLHSVHICVFQRGGTCVHIGTQTLTRTPARRHLTHSPTWSRSRPQVAWLLGLCMHPRARSRSYTHAPGPALTPPHSTVQRSGAHHPITSFTFRPGQLGHVGTECGEIPSASRCPASPLWPWTRPAGASLRTWARAVGKRPLPGRWDGGPREGGQV